jgi:hypothetical protein
VHPVLVKWCAQRFGYAEACPLVVDLLDEATMSHAHPMHHQQPPTLGLTWLIIAVVFFLLPGALTLLALLLSELIL